VGAASLQLLETRIDAMVLRAGYARTIGDDGARLRELPEATQIPVTCQLPLVVEFYSR